MFKEYVNHSTLLNNSQNCRHSFFVPYSIDLTYSQKAVNKNHYPFTQVDSVAVQQINAVHDEPKFNLNLRDQLTTSNLADSVTIQKISTVHDKPTSNLNLGADTNQLTKSNLADSVTVQQISTVNNLSVSASAIGNFSQSPSTSGISIGVNSDSILDQNNVIHANPPTVVQDRTSEEHLKLNGISKNNLILYADVSDSCSQLIHAMATLNTESSSNSYFNDENTVNSLSLIY